MDEELLQSRLSRISTVWTLLADAHGTLDSEARGARMSLIQRYQGAAYRYLLGAVHNADMADELFQEFALRFIQGAFSRADPHRGRFRDYLKTTLYHLIVDYHKRERLRPRLLDLEVAEPAAAVEPDQSDARFVESWRNEILNRAWAALARAERGGGSPYCSVLKYRAEHPDASSVEMAAALNEQLRPEHPLNETSVRKTLQRARAQFADALLDDVAASLGEHAPDQLEQELIDLDLLRYCRSALDRRLGREKPQG